MTTSAPNTAPLASQISGDTNDWYRDAVLYQIYPRSFQDSNGDGVGDLRGIVERLDYLAWLGVDGIWLSPINVSPNRDFGYDVADYYDVDPTLGTLADLDELVAKAREHGIKVLMDLVPNHTSDQHPWFQDALTSRTARFRDWYVWADPKPDGSVPNNWMAAFHGTAWELHEPTGQYYLHNFLTEQPDLNWWNDEVREEFDRILQFWFDRGIAGFRIDVCHGIVKDKLLRDDPPLTPDELGGLHGEPWENKRVYSAGRPEVHEVLQHWRTVSNRYAPQRVLLGETWAETPELLAKFFGDDGDSELQLAFNFHYTEAPLEAEALQSEVAKFEAVLPEKAWPVWTGSNHDIPRFPTRWADGDTRKARAALFVLLTLRGTPVLYYGDEIGMENVAVPREKTQDLRDIVDLPNSRPSRDGERTPMQWDATPQLGFTGAGVETWLPCGDGTKANVADQERDPASMLTLTRSLISLRKTSLDLRRGDYRALPAPAGTWVHRRGEATIVAANLTDDAVSVELPADGKVVAATAPSRSGARASAHVELAPWECIAVELERSITES